MGVNVRVDGLMILTGAVVGAGALVYLNRGKIAEAINPVSENNLANKALHSAAGTENVNGFFDNIVYGATLVNPFANESLKRQAKVHFGLDDENQLLGYAAMRDVGDEIQPVENVGGYL